MSKWAEILALKASRKLSSDKWYSATEILAECELPSDSWLPQIPQLLEEIGRATGRIDKRSGQRDQWRINLQLPNPRGDDLRVQVGVAFMRDRKWYAQEDFAITGYTDHQKMVQEMRSAGYATERKRERGRQRYRLTSDIPSSPARKSRLPTGQKRRTLFGRGDYACAFCREQYKDVFLAPDHKIPVSRGGTIDLARTDWMDFFQTTCVSCNHRKREACKQCPNGDPGICRTCFWHDPNEFAHIATRGTTCDWVFWPNAALRKSALQKAKDAGLSIDQYIVQLVRKATNSS
jgi:5-methylcytosine-specific restriction endonuclease McrA